MKARRNLLVLILVGFLWAVFFYIAVQVISEAIGRLSDPANAEKAAKAYGAATVGISLVAGVLLATLGTWKGVLPGARPRLRPLAPKELMLLERLDALRDEGILTEDEFIEQKARLLGDNLD